MQQVIPEFDQRRGTQHNFHTVQVLFRSFQRVELVANDWLPSWVRTFLFDAVCGNTDRHQNNWGLLADDVGTLRRFRLSPCYDNGTSLGHELNETHHGGWNETQFQAYIRRGRHHMKWAQGDPKGVQHLDLITRLATLSKASVHEAVEAHVWRMDLGELEEGLNRLCSLQIPIPLTSWRAGLILRLVKLRRAQLLEALK